MMIPTREVDVKEVESFGGNVQLTSVDHKSGTDRVGEVAANLDKNDLVINVQGDEPFIDQESVNAVAFKLKYQNEDHSIISLCRPMSVDEDVTDPNMVKVVLDRAFNALYFSRSPIPYNRSGNVIPYYLHLGIYGFPNHILQDLVRLRPTALEETEKLEQLRWLSNGYKIELVETTHKSFGIDAPEDLELARKRVAKKL